MTTQESKALIDSSENKIITSAWFGGLCLIIGGIVLAAKLYDNAKREEHNVESAARDLDAILKNHQKI